MRMGFDTGGWRGGRDLAIIEGRRCGGAGRGRTYQMMASWSFMHGRMGGSGPYGGA
jgi:hypothetical protein